MLKEVLEYLELEQGQVVVDCTFGFGGHAYEIAKKVGPSGRVIGFERDQRVFDRGVEKTKQKNITIVNDNFTNIGKNIEKEGVERADRVLFDLGISTFHYKESGGGFSFSKDEPLDMRLDQFGASAADLVNGLSERELADLFYNLAEERRSRQIAKQIVCQRKKEKIVSSLQLAEIVESVVRRSGKTHPATRVFQALRIAVNSELENISLGMDEAMKILKNDGIILIITFHSLEDRIVKNKFKDWERDGLAKIITKKPIAPTRDECISNPPSRSAKIRVARRV